MRGAGQITLPKAFCKALQLREGDYLEAGVLGGGLLMKPVMVVRRSAAKKSRAGVKKQKS